jgi:hypothetical protein
MTLLQAPPVPLAGFEGLAGPGQRPEYVLPFTPPRQYERVRDRLTKPGFWELLTLDEYEAGDRAPEEWTLDAPRTIPEADLIAWVSELLGYLVALKRDDVEMRADGLLARYHREPWYWVLRNS